VKQLDSQCLSRRYVQRACKRAAPPAGATTDALVGAAAVATAVEGNSLERAAATLTGDAPAETAMETTEVSVGPAGPTAVVVGNESAGAGTLGGVRVGNETTLAGRLSRKQAKNLKQRMNKMSHVLSGDLSACIETEM
jgi:hypothetical protein